MPWKEPPENPQGLVLYDSFVVGSRIGAGAQALVHSIVDTRSGVETDFVVKLAKTANPNLSKKKFLEASLNSSFLNGERTRYKFHFPSGAIVPSLPDRSKKNATFEGTTSGTSVIALLFDRCY